MHNDEKIWQVVHRIPPGSVATYGQVARLAQLPGYARFVGRVLKNLPAGTRLPWFRVLNAQGRISFAPDSSQYRRQQELLEAEGVVFMDRRLDLRRYQWNP